MAITEVAPDDVAPIAAPVAALREVSPADFVPTQMTGLAREAALPASFAAKGVLQGVAMPGDLLRTAVHLYSKYLGAPLARAVTGEGTEFSGHNPLDSDTLLGAARTLGAVDRPDLQPQTLREKLEAGAAQGAGAAAPMLLVTGGAGAAPLLAQGAGAGAGAEIGKEIAPEHPIIGSVVGGLVGGVAGGSAANLTMRGVNALRGEVSPVVEAYDRLGIPTRLTGDVSDSPGLRQTQAFAARTPGGAGRVEAASRQTVDDFGGAVERTATNLGFARTEAQAGNTLQAEARNWRDAVFPARQQAAWAPVDAALGPNAPVPLDNYRRVLTDVTGHLGRLAETGETLIPPRARQLLDSLNVDLPQGIPQLGIANAPATWQEAQRLRSLVGEALGTPAISQEIGERNLGRIYGALSQDMRGTAVAAGAEHAFDAANVVSTQGHGFIRNVLSKVIKSANPMQESVAPEQAARNVLNGGDATITAVRQEMPMAADELAAFKLRDMALATPGRQSAAGNATSPGTFLTDFSHLRQSAPAGTDALFADPAVRQSVDDLATVAGSIRETAARLNHSNTASHVVPSIAAVGAVPAGLAGYEAGGLPGAAMAAGGELALPFVAGNVAGRLTTSQALARLLSTPIEAPPREAAIAARLLATRAIVDPSANPAPAGPRR